VTLYWFTNTISRSFYPYRDALACPYHGVPEYFIKKPLGFSFFPFETMPTPRSWVETTGNLVWSRVHDQGGHFAALERPEEFLSDVEEFIREAVKHCKAIVAVGEGGELVRGMGFSEGMKGMVFAKEMKGELAKEKGVGKGGVGGEAHCWVLVWLR